MPRLAGRLLVVIESLADGHENRRRDKVRVLVLDFYHLIIRNTVTALTGSVFLAFLHPRSRKQHHTPRVAVAC
jgi:hypothetical protein